MFEREILMIIKTTIIIIFLYFAFVCLLGWLYLGKWIFNLIPDNATKRIKEE